MADRIPIPLRPVAVSVESELFKAISGWPFADTFVSRLLRWDIPRRTLLKECRVWTYRDPQGSLVGFGTLDVCSEYGDLTDGFRHPYIPLLAVNPTLQNRGYGTSIVRHLIDEAALMASQGGDIHSTLFLDVYQSNIKAISLYRKSGFVQIGDAELDPLENNQPFIIMAQSVAVSSA